VDVLEIEGPRDSTISVAGHQWHVDRTNARQQREISRCRRSRADQHCRRCQAGEETKTPGTAADVVIDGKTLSSVSSTAGGEVDGSTRFNYRSR
jgi:hypothetical protein